MMHVLRVTAGRRLLAIALAAAAPALVAPVAHAATGGGGAGSVSKLPSGGASTTGHPPTSKPKRQPTARAPKKGQGHWLSAVTITEYWPAPETWFSGALVTAPGLAGKHRIDWLYSATGVSMEGGGIGVDGSMYHIDSLGNAGWVTASGRATSAANGFAAGAPFWRAGAYWRTSKGAVTFPLAAGGWSAGTGRKYVPLRGVTFAPGASLSLRFYQSIAVDPKVIPIGSRVYVPAYAHDGHGGWFTAQDTGGAINGRHIDVYRSPPASPGTGGQYLTGQRILVIKPSQ